MIDWLVNRIFRWDPLRKAIFDEVGLYQSVDKAMWEYEKEGPTNLTWSEGDTWYGWTYNKGKKSEGAVNDHLKNNNGKDKRMEEYLKPASEG